MQESEKHRPTENYAARSAKYSVHVGRGSLQLKVERAAETLRSARPQALLIARQTARG